jgi:hypothetical protein
MSLLPTRVFSASISSSSGGNQISDTTNMSLLPIPRYTINVTTNSSGAIIPNGPISVKNQTTPIIPTIADILDIPPDIQITDGSTITYNATTHKYEIGPVDIQGDFGEF